VPARPTPGGLEQRLLARARRVGLARGDRLVVAFSGGRDSLALAAALRRVRASLGVDLLLIHIDHRLRPTSAQEAARAAELARVLDLACRLEAVSAPLARIHPGVGIEEAARRERYRILFDVAGQLGARAVATAHHEGDQAETVLLHLLRGGGVHGAAGMAEISPPPSHPPDHDISQQRDRPFLWRPLLTESPAIIRRYVRSLGLTPVQDPSNADVALRRNALRHDILPRLEQLAPGASAALARYAMLAAEDDALLDEFAAAALADAAGVDPGGRLDSAHVLAQPLPLQRRMLRLWLARVTGAPAFSANRIDALLELARTRRGGRTIEIGEGWTVRAERGTLRAEQTATGAGGEG
jgi:tRNA(Ile)-lysidine synthase